MGVSSRVEGLDGRASAAAARIEQIGAAMAEQVSRWVEKASHASLSEKC